MSPLGLSHPGETPLARGRSCPPGQRRAGCWPGYSCAGAPGGRIKGSHVGPAFIFQLQRGANKPCPRARRSAPCSRPQPALPLSSSFPERLRQLRPGPGARAREQGEVLPGPGPLTCTLPQASRVARGLRALSRTFRQSRVGQWMAARCPQCQPWAVLTAGSPLGWVTSARISQAQSHTEVGEPGRAFPMGPARGGVLEL